MMEILSKMTRAPVCFERHLELLCDDTGNCWTDLRFNVEGRGMESAGMTDEDNIAVSFNLNGIKIEPGPHPQAVLLGTQ